MAVTASVSFTSANTASVTVDYSVTSTDTSTTIKVTRVRYSATAKYSHTVSVSVRVAGAALWSVTNKAIAYNATTVELLGSSAPSKAIAKTHSSQSVQIEVSLTDRLDGYNGGTYSSKRTLTASATASQTVSAKTSYTISYSAGSGTHAVGSPGTTAADYGTGAPSSQTKWHGEALTLSSARPTCPNHVFKCWNTKADGSGTSYNPGASYVANAAATLHAIWNPVVTYDANGGTGAPAAQTKTFGSTLALSTTRPTRAGYVFHGWGYHATEKITWSGGSKYFYSPGEGYTSDVSATLYAIWDPVIAYDANGGSGAPSAQTKVRWETLRLQTATPTRPGYVFDRWNTASNGSGTDYAGGSGSATLPATMNDHVTLYAQWLREPAAPTISSLTVVRWSGHASGSTGRQDDAGTQARIVVKWRVDTTSDTVAGNAGTVAAPSLSPSSGVSAGAWSHSTSGGVTTSTCYVDGVDTDTQYAVTVRVTDLKPTTTSRTVILTRARFEMDFLAGGGAAGIGCAAPASGLEVGWDTQFDGKLNVLGNATVGGSLAVTGDLSAPQLTRTRVPSDVATAAASWTIVDQYADTYGKVVQVRLRLRPAAAVAAGATATIATLDSAYRPALHQGFANYYGIGQVTNGGAVSFRASVAITTSTDVYVGLCFLKS